MNRRDMLGMLGAGSASTLLWAFGCRAPAPAVPTATASAGEVRTWLHDAIRLVRGAGLDAPHALAVTRRRTTAAIDVLGAGVSRERRGGVVLAAIDRDGARREQVTSELSAAGVAAAARALIGDRAASPAHVDFGRPQVWSGKLDEPDDGKLLELVDKIRAGDTALSSRIVYQATSIDIDDATTWSVAPGVDLEQRLVRVRQAATRVAWNGTHPVTSEVARAWTGGLADHVLAADQVSAASRDALLLVTPGAFEDGDYAVVLEPELAAALVDVATRALLTTAALRRPEVARRLALGANVASPLLTLIDAPATAGAYGGFHFDDEGVAAAPVTLLDQGRVAGRLADTAGVAAGLAPVAGRGRRPGHLGRVEPLPSHLQLAAGTGDADALLDDGYVLEGARGATIDPASDRVVLGVARARELRGGRRTGRVYADVELVGDLAALLASVSAVSAKVDVIGVRDESAGRPRWRSIEAPWLRAKGRVRARRGLA